VQKRLKMYQTPTMYRIDVVAIDSRIVYTTGYAGKALKTPRFDEDDIDIQSRYNVSDELARALVNGKRSMQ
jgi:hypothetical protein